MMGTGLSITHNYAIDDGILDGFLLDTVDLASIKGAVDRFFSHQIRRCQSILSPGT